MRAYFSCPISIGSHTYNELLNVITDHFIHVTYWKRGSVYSNLNLVEAQVIVVALPNLVWRMDWEHLTAGIRKELEYAVKARIPIFLLYKNQRNGVELYRTEIPKKDGEPVQIKGIGGTATSIKDYLIKLEVDLTPIKNTAGVKPYFDGAFDNVPTVTKPFVRDEEGLWAKDAIHVKCLAELWENTEMDVKWLAELWKNTEIDVTYDKRLLL